MSTLKWREKTGGWRARRRLEKEDGVGVERGGEMVRCGAGWAVFYGNYRIYDRDSSRTCALPSERPHPA